MNICSLRLQTQHTSLSSFTIYCHAHTRTHTRIARLHPSFACLSTHWQMRGCAFLHVGELFIKDAAGSQVKYRSGFSGQQEVKGQQVSIRGQEDHSTVEKQRERSDLCSVAWFCWVVQGTVICLSYTHTYIYILSIPTVTTLLWIIRCSFHVLLGLFFLMSLLEPYFFIFKVKVKIGRSLQFNCYKSLCEFPLVFVYMRRFAGFCSFCLCVCVIQWVCLLSCVALYMCSYL